MNVLFVFNFVIYVFSVFNFNEFKNIKKILMLRTNVNCVKRNAFYTHNNLKNILNKNYCHCCFNNMFLLRPMKGFKTKHSQFDKKKLFNK